MTGEHNLGHSNQLQADGEVSLPLGVGGILLGEGLGDGALLLDGLEGRRRGFLGERPRRGPRAPRVRREQQSNDTCVASSQITEHARRGTGGALDMAAGVDGTIWHACACELTKELPMKTSKSLVVGMALGLGVVACGADSHSADELGHQSASARSSDSGNAKADLDASPGADANDCVVPEVCVNEEVQTWSGLCLRSASPVPGASLNRVCVVSPDGVLGWMWVRGDLRLSEPSVRHSGWAGGYVPSTLSDSEESACLELLATASSSTCWSVSGGT